MLPEDELDFDDLPARTKRRRRAPWRPATLPTVRHELVLYAELFAFALFMLVLRELAISPWSYYQHVQNRIHEMNPAALSTNQGSQLVNDCDRLARNVSVSASASLHRTMPPCKESPKLSVPPTRSCLGDFNFPQGVVTAEEFAAITSLDRPSQGCHH